MNETVELNPAIRSRQPPSPHETIAAAGQSNRWVKHWLALILVVAGWMALPLDLPLARWSLGGNCPDPFAKWFALCEVFAHGLGVSAILVTIAILDPRHRKALPRLITASFGSGLLANMIKLIVARARPHSFAFDRPIAETFSQWFPLTSAGSHYQGFPSAHMATATGLAIGLAWLYPRGRWLFWFFAVSAGCQRVVSGDHFLSDVVWARRWPVSVRPDYSMAVCFPARSTS